MFRDEAWNLTGHRFRFCWRRSVRFMTPFLTGAESPEKSCCSLNRLNHREKSFYTKLLGDQGKKKH